MTKPQDVLAEAGFEPDFNVCASCKHHGGEHDLGNWCLVCPRPEMPARPIEARLAAGWCYFASMTESQEWEHGIAQLAARGYALVRTPETQDFIAQAQHFRAEHDATHGEAEMCGGECIVLGLAEFAPETLDVERLARALRDWEARRHPVPSPGDDDGPHNWDAWNVEARKLIAAASPAPDPRAGLREEVLSILNNSGVYDSMEAVADVFVATFYARFTPASPDLTDGPWAQLSEAATPGPWHVEEMRGKRDGYIRAGGRTVGDLRYRNGEADAAFIVAAVNYVRAALAPSAEPPETD